MGRDAQGITLLILAVGALGACSPATDGGVYAANGVGLCTLSENAGVLAHARVTSWGTSYVDGNGRDRTPVTFQVDQVVRGSLATGAHTLKMFGRFDTASGALAIPEVPAERAVLVQGGQDTEGYLFLWKDDPSVVEGSGYLWREADGLFHSGSTADGLVDGVTAQTILDADGTCAGRASCPSGASDGGTADAGP